MSAIKDQEMYISAAQDLPSQLDVAVQLARQLNTHLLKLWDELPEPAKVIVRDLAYKILDRPKASRAVNDMCNTVFSLVEREHLRYEETVASALEQAMCDEGAPTMTADQFGEWLNDIPRPAR